MCMGKLQILELFHEIKINGRPRAVVFYQSLIIILNLFILLFSCASKFWSHGELELKVYKKFAALKLEL